MSKQIYANIYLLSEFHLFTIIERAMVWNINMKVSLDWSLVSAFALQQTRFVKYKNGCIKLRSLQPIMTRDSKAKRLLLLGWLAHAGKFLTFSLQMLFTQWSIYVCVCKCTIRGNQQFDCIKLTRKSKQKQGNTIFRFKNYRKSKRNVAL